VPALLELREQTIGASHRVGVAGHALRATVLPLGHKLSTFQHGHVLLHGCKRHLVPRRQLADGRVGVHHAGQNVAPRGIGQRPEQLVQVVSRRLSIYNHMVVDTSTVATRRPMALEGQYIVKIQPSCAQTNDLALLRTGTATDGAPRTRGRFAFSTASTRRPRTITAAIRRWHGRLPCSGV